MKHFVFILLTVAFATVCTCLPLGYPCAISDILAGIRRFNFDQENGRREDYSFEIFRNRSVTHNDETMKGTFKINGIWNEYRPSWNYNYDQIHQKLYINSTIIASRFTGFYEIVDGQVSEPTLGHHSFSGKGVLNVSLSASVFRFAARISVDQNSQQRISLADVTFFQDSDYVSLFAENLVVDGISVQWESINNNMQPLFEKILEAFQDFKSFKKNFVKLFKGCVLLDITSTG